MIFSVMRKIKLTLLALLAVTLTGCEKPTQANTGTTIESGVSRKLKAEKITRFGHSYVYFYDQSGGYAPVNVIHDPDCPCRKKGGENE